MPPKQESGSNAASQNSQRNSNPSSGAPEQTNYRIIKDGWGDRPSFQSSFGLGMTPEDIEGGNRILDGFRKADREEWEEAQKNASGGGGGAAGRQRGGSEPSTLGPSTVGTSRRQNLRDNRHGNSFVAMR
ncbi:hypothetical protein V495_04792 [Pseudogymnoascus sp. VKM F-4514 (FW-929)]|nr:hypothetical protein V495_04792 [Pseudogymnoascus sp. VKM F-4514 (FW-929)]KFY59378.1 hypothetical protein V497_04344 [Pseudogymnoascus sp. VKM F-4516 (FW-969)]